MSDPPTHLRPAGNRNPATLFGAVRVFDSARGVLTAPSDVLVEGPAGAFPKQGRSGGGERLLGGAG